MVWSQSSGTLRGHEGQPLVIEDVGGKPMMFIESGWPNIVQALDLERSGSSGAGVELHQDQRPRRVGGAARLLRHRQSRHCRMRTASSCSAPWTATSSPSMPRPARKIWVVKQRLSRTTARPSRRRRSSPNDKVIIGFGGDEFAARGSGHGLQPRRRQEGVGVPFHRQRQGCVPDARTPTRSIRSTARPARIFGISTYPGR